MPNDDTTEEDLPEAGGPQSVSNIGHIEARPIVTEMEESYLAYAMSVIKSRALPDARDGLKPVQRRILVTLNDLNLRTKMRKCAKICGDVSGNYHPHGESIVYPSLARLAQDFSLRYPLAVGQGNFGSIDGDSPAAMRYTEAKMSKMTDELLKDLDKDTVNYDWNYDATRKEPTVLPSKLPNLLLNGTVGIAVGMATNIPPHNLNEIVDAVMHLADNPDATIDDLLQHVKGPDFPTGGIVYDQAVLTQAYHTGRGSVKVRSKCEIEEMKNGKYRIRVWELPYQVNKMNLIMKMASLVTDKTIQGISDIRDESNRDGIRIIIEMKKDAYPQKILNQLYKHTELQSSFGYNTIALTDGLQPKLLNLKEMMDIFLTHRREVITRRVTYERDRALERAHILEGLKIALDNIDEVIALIRASKTKEIAKEGLIKKFKLSEIQAVAILHMRLQTLAGLERKKIEEELAEKLAFIAECNAILADPKRIDSIMKDELAEMKDRFGDERRTQIVSHAIGKFNAKDTIPNVPMIVTLTETGYVKRLSPNQFRAQNRGGKGVKGMTTKDDDVIQSMLHVMNHDDLLFFTNTGRVFQIPAYELPQGSRIAKGQAIVNLLQLQPNEHVTAILKSKVEDKTHLFFATKHGQIKRVEIEQFSNIRKSGLIAQKMKGDDELRWVLATSGEDEIFLLTKKGKAIRFSEDDVRPMGRSAAGVRGIRLAKDDVVVRAALIEDPKVSSLLVVMENGLGKMTAVDQYRAQGRGGSGVKAAQLTAKTGDIVGGFVLQDGTDGDLICISKQGQTIRMELTDIPSRGRATQGVIVMKLKAKDAVASMSVITAEGEEEVKEETEAVKAEVKEAAKKLDDAEKELIKKKKTAKKA